jgi:PHP family Zn ribbon phosphoesterase
MVEKDTKKKVEETVEEILDETSQTPMERFFYHQRRALEETGKALEALLPTGFREHGGRAGEEFTKGFRILIDATIDELKKISEREEEPTKPAEPEAETEKEEEKPSTTGKTKVKVKVD